MIANIHAAAILDLSEQGEAILIGAADAKQENAVKFTAEHGIEPYASIDELLSDPRVDAVCVCTPSGYHAEHALSAISHGKHVVLEKPMALSTSDAEKIVQACSETGYMLTVISQLRFSDDVKRLRQIIENASLGRILMCDLKMKYWRDREYYSSSSWCGSLKHDGGVLMNQGIHGIDLLSYILEPCCSDDDIRILSAVTRNLYHEIEAEDTVSAAAEFGDILCSIYASTCAYPGFDRRLEVIGEKGYAILRENRLEKLMIDGRDILYEINPTGCVNTSADPTALDYRLHKLQVHNLIHAIRGEEELAIGVRDGKRAVDIIDAIYRVSRNKK